MKSSPLEMENISTIAKRAKALKPYAQPLLKRYKMSAVQIETYQVSSGTKSSIQCATARCTGGKGAAAPADIPPWLLP